MTHLGIHFISLLPVLLNWFNFWSSLASSQTWKLIPVKASQHSWMSGGSNQNRWVQSLVVLMYSIIMPWICPSEPQQHMVQQGELSWKLLLPSDAAYKDQFLSEWMLFIFLAVRDALAAFQYACKYPGVVLCWRLCTFASAADWQETQGGWD